VDLDRLPDELALHTRELPPEPLWREAQRRGAEILGLTPRELLNAANLASFVAEARGCAQTRREPVARYAERLEAALSRLGLADQGERARTLHATRALLLALADADDDALVAALAGAGIATSETAMAGCLTGAGDLATALAAVNWELFDILQDLPAPFHGEAAALRAELLDALGRDEHVQALAPVLADCQQRALGLIQRALSKPPPAVKPPPDEPAKIDPPPSVSPGLELVDEVHHEGLKGRKFAEALLALSKQMDGHPDLEVSLSWKIYRRRR